MEIAEKAFLQGSLTSVGSYTLHGNSQIITPFGQYPLWMVTGVIGGSSSLVNDALHQYVFREIPVNKKAKHDISLVLSAVTSGLFYNQAMGLVNPDLPKEFGFYQGMAVGSGAELASALILDMIR